MSFNEQMKRELAQVRKETDEALEKSGGDFEAGMRAALDHALAGLPIDLKILRAHGFVVEGGSYYLGSQVAAFTHQGVDPLAAFHHPLVSRLLHEFTEKARKL